MDVSAVFDRYRPVIEKELRETLLGRSPLYTMIHYQLGWVDEQGNPRSSPASLYGLATLCLLSCRASGGEAVQALPAAVAVELVHQFRLVHDDIREGNPERDHRPTVWWLWGPGQAINAGDALHALARLAVFRLRERGVPGNKVLQAVKHLDQACLQLCEGQYLDITYQERMDITLRSYLDMAERKSGALVGCAMALGALLAGRGEELVSAFDRCGRKLGLALQITEEITQFWGELDRGGASLALLNKKKTLPLVYALDKAPFKEKRELGTLYFKRVLDREDLRQVADSLRRLGAKEFAEEMAQHYFREAFQELEGFKELSAQDREELQQAAGFLALKARVPPGPPSREEER